MTREYADNLVHESDDGEVKVLVKSQAYAEFSDWIDQELVKLVDRWAHCAAPNAEKPRRKLKQPR